jgi:hypothetical protein
MNAPCIVCRVCRRGHSIGIESNFVEDRESYEPAVVRRDRNGGPNDMPSRADRNRLRRIAHVDLFAWLMHQRLP